MDLTNNIINNNKNKNPGTETESPPKIILLGDKKSRSFTGISFLPLLIHMVVISYKECLKNHAASLGGHALDGCGEFMPGPAAASGDPTSLKCAACGCHRNFHRRDPYEPNAIAATHFLVPPPTAAAAAAASPSTDPSTAPSPDTNTSSPQHHQPATSPAPCSFYSSAPHMLLALSTGFSAPSGDHQHPHPHPHFNQVLVRKSSSDNGKKRSRTKFTQEQKEKMLTFAERLGWKMNRAEEKSTQEFCSEVGVSRRVFKVWMHNNKNAFGKKDQMGINNNKNINDNNNVNGSSRVSFDINGFSSNGKDHNEGNGNVHLVMSPKSEE